MALKMFQLYVGMKIIQFVCLEAVRIPILVSQELKFTMKAVKCMQLVQL